MNVYNVSQVFVFSLFFLFQIYVDEKLFDMKKGYSFFALLSSSCQDEDDDDRFFTLHI